VSFSQLRAPICVGDLGKSVHTERGGVTSAHFRVGDGIEIQWKRQPAHPLGWWYGHVQQIWVDSKLQTGPVGDILHIVSQKMNEEDMPVLHGECVLVPDAGKKTTEAAAAAAASSNKKEEEHTPRRRAPLINKITVEFRQYNPNSPWFTVTMVVGTKTPVRGMGGYVGGIRRPSSEERERWESYLASQMKVQLDPLGHTPVMQI
jgi:hypothetical protein